MVILVIFLTRGYQAVVETLLAHGANVNQQNSRGATPLHEAICSNRAETIPTLIAAAADLNAINREGLTPLELAHTLSGTTIYILGQAPMPFNQSIITLLDDYNLRIQESRARAHNAAEILAQATHPRLGENSPLALLGQFLLQDISVLTKEAEERAARQPRQ